MDHVPLGKIQRCLIQTEEDEDSITDRSRAIFTRNNTKKQVWIQWKPYPHTSKEAPEVCVRRAVALVESLNHRAPHLDNLMGWIDDYDSGETRIGFVFEIPLRWQWATPISLRSLLEQTGTARPSIEARNALAYSLYHAIRYLHSISLYHGDLRSHNIIYYHHINAAKVDYTGFYISGFALPIPPFPIDYTLCHSLDGDNLYRHPIDQEFSPILKRDLDMYSFGVILYEVAYWEPIYRVLEVEPARGYDVKFAITVRERLLEDSQLSKLSDAVGESYAKLVQMFLTGLEGSFHDSLEKLLKDLYDRGGCKGDVSLI